MHTILPRVAPSPTVRSRRGRAADPRALPRRSWIHYRRVAVTYLRYWLVGFVLYSLVVPFVLVDVGVTIYQWVCFPLCGLARLRRREYFTFDRHRLPYLNGIQKLNCTYCAYANGLFTYVREVTARTEAYWCPIKHEKATTAGHAYYEHFLDFGDAAGFRAGASVVPECLTLKQVPNVPAPQHRPRRRARSSGRGA